MRYEWDENKRLLNLQKHGLDFRDAPDVLCDPYGIEVIAVVDGEERTHFIGESECNPLIGFVVYTERETAGPEEVIRIISFRKATKTERVLYKNGIQRTHKGRN
jgi:uncharacterized DUF497 family protein